VEVIAINGPRDCVVEDRSEPRISDNYALVKILAAPMCTEFHQYRSGDISDSLGHEASGEIAAVGPGSRLSVGQRVVVMPQNGCGKCPLCLAGEHIRCETPRDPLGVCDSETGRATYAQYLIQQDWLLLPVPDDISIEHAAMACCGFGPTFASMQAMSVGPLDTVLINGLGPVGLGGVINATVRGARTIGIEGNPYRAALAKELGADAVIDPSSPEALEQVYALTKGLGVDKSIEASSQESAPGFVLKATRRGGQMCSVGWGGPVNMRDVVARGVEIRGIWHWNHLRHAEAMFETIRRADKLIEKFITHRFPLVRAKEAFEIQLTGQCAKIVLQPWA
jgi:threonine dehydrogenase-like Zn-dependent dehydrogenase